MNKDFGYKYTKKSCEIQAYKSIPMRYVEKRMPFCPFFQVQIAHNW